MKRFLTKLMSRAGECKSAVQSEDKERLPAIVEGEGHHAGSENRMDHWSVVCRSCDRRGARCFGVSPASAEETTRSGNRVFFCGGFAALNSDRGGGLFTDGQNAKRHRGSAQTMTVPAVMSAREQISC